MAGDRGGPLCLYVSRFLEKNARNELGAVQELFQVIVWELLMLATFFS